MKSQLNPTSIEFAMVSGLDRPGLLRPSYSPKQHKGHLFFTLGPHRMEALAVQPHLHTNGVENESRSGGGQLVLTGITDALRRHGTVKASHLRWGRETAPTGTPSPPFPHLSFSYCDTTLAAGLLLSGLRLLGFIPL